MRIVHAADLHIDSPLRGLPPYEGAPLTAVREAPRRACERLVAYCIESKASLLLLAGDLYDGDWRDFSTGLFFANEMSRLREAGVRVAVVFGNHDAESVITRRLDPPSNVRGLSSKRAETIIYDDLGVAVHGRSFPSKAVTEDLSREYPEPIAGLFNIGLLHTCAEGRPGHDAYAPCKVDDLRARGYDYWALGHVHQREVLSRDPWIVFPGNLQGRHVRETGAKGATVVDVEAGRIESVEHVALDVVRWAECTITMTEGANVDDVIDAARAELSAELERAEGRVLAARLVVRGPESITGRVAAQREAVTNEIRAVANDLQNVYFEKLKIETNSAPKPIVSGEWVDALATLADLSDEEILELAEDALSEVRSKLPLDLARGDGGLMLDDPETLRALLREAQQAVIVQARDATNESGEDAG
jgi:DNA repair exonuclease SbcCD nuclease subunit